MSRNRLNSCGSTINTSGQHSPSYLFEQTKHILQDDLRILLDEDLRESHPHLAKSTMSCWAQQTPLLCSAKLFGSVLWEDLQDNLSLTRYTMKNYANSKSQKELFNAF